MKSRDSAGTVGLSLAATLLVVAIGYQPAAAGAGDDPTTIREVEVVGHAGQRRVILRGEDEGPVLVRSVVVQRAWLGVSLLDITPELCRHFGVPEEDSGVLVSRVVEDGPAGRAGIEVGDVLVSIDGRRVSRAHHLVAELGGKEAGDGVRIEGWRRGLPVNFTAELAETRRPEVDVTPFLAVGADWEDYRNRLHQLHGEHREEVLELDGAALDEAFRNLEQELENDGLEHHVLRFQEHRGGLVERLEALEERLRQLEVEIDELPPDQD